MKCPNCSFANTDDIKTCRVCGFDLTPIGSPEPLPQIHSQPDRQMPDTKLSKHRMIDDSEDEALDSAFKSIFELKDDVADNLQKKRPIQPITSEATDENDGDEDGDGDADEYVDEVHKPFNKKKVILMVSLLVMLFMLLGLKYVWSGPTWKYVSNIETTEPIEVASTEVENTTETVFSLGEDASIVPVNDFFNLLPEFINRGNLSILSLFDNSQEALEVLTSFAVIGNLEKIAEATVIESEEAMDSAFYKVTTLTNRLINGQQTQTASTWDFRAVLKNDKWILESMAVETGPLVPTEPTIQPSTENTTEATTEKQTEPTNETTTESTTAATTEATTENSQTLFKGFKSKGSFSGGEKASGQDVAFVRYGSHDTFERLAFDLYEWIGGKPSQPVAVSTNYTASLSDDGRTISIIVNGAIEAYASQSSLDLTHSANIESVSYNYFGNGEAVAITIILKQPSQFKVFNLVSPAKLVVDIAPYK